MPKRKWPDVAHDAPLASWDVEAVSSFLLACDALPEDVRAAVAAKAEEDSIDGEVLATLSEAELGARSFCALRPPPCAASLRALSPTYMRLQLHSALCVVPRGLLTPSVRVALRGYPRH